MKVLPIYMHIEYTFRIYEGSSLLSQFVYIYYIYKGPGALVLGSLPIHFVYPGLGYTELYL